MTVPPHQRYAIGFTERVCSVVSLIGTAVIVISFLSSPSFRKPINRLVFFASWGNMMTNIATIISATGMQAGINTPLCHFQGFLIQWFMPADALWTFAMACNVYLTFFHKYNSERLRQLEWKYLLFCYGLPFIPAFTYLFVVSESRGAIYGSATLWCWVSDSWDFLRIATFYGPVWFVVFLTFVIYARAGSVIYKQRRQLEEIGGHDSALDVERPLRRGLTRTTEIRITSEPTHRDTEAVRTVAAVVSSRVQSLYDPYSVSIEGGGIARPECCVAASKQVDQNDLEQCFTATTIASPLFPSPPPLPPITPLPQRRRMRSDASSAAWVYTKYAILFFCAMLITWVPSTVNRAYGIFHPGDFNFALNYVSSFVLPLQGFWNSIIYVSISWPAFKEAFARLKKDRLAGSSQGSAMGVRERAGGRFHAQPWGVDERELLSD
ncbi:putative cAMP receptor-like protein [Aspergillus candidus]|uniref:Family A G protein-coupled receptor-like protein n=1 Tax=Aspergillus candidus TaxID=41067 RepID=A0A2I2EYE4_ASPCN|nr:family A G protein-coupled receptor-like protein [Aspergillus candidus]PLB33397.1 family A G protein-coupled receptor-like protein [Aspergillus candidus]